MIFVALMALVGKKLIQASFTTFCRSVARNPSKNLRSELNPALPTGLLFNDKKQVLFSRLSRRCRRSKQQGKRTLMKTD
jgi:hypothetical protein